METVDYEGPVYRPRFENLEYNSLQDMDETFKLELLDLDHRYYELLENPSPLLKVVYTEKILEYIKLHSKVYDRSNIGELVRVFLGDLPPKEETMKDLGVVRNNAIHFIKDTK